MKKIVFIFQVHLQKNTLYLQVVDEFTTAETHLHMWGGSLGMVDRNGADRRTEGHLTYMDSYHPYHHHYRYHHHHHHHCLVPGGFVVSV